MCGKVCNEAVVDTIPGGREVGAGRDAFVRGLCLSRPDERIGTREKLAILSLETGKG